MSNAERQRKFRKSHPGYYSRRRRKPRATPTPTAQGGPAIATAPTPQPARPVAEQQAAFSISVMAA